MQYRKKIHNRGRDRRVFSSTADKIKSINLRTPMRGGIRL